MKHINIEEQSKGIVAISQETEATGYSNALANIQQRAVEREKQEAEKPSAPRPRPAARPPAGWD